MASQSEIRAAFAHAVNDARQEELISWLMKVDERVVSIAAPFDLLDFTDPGYVLLWEQSHSVDTALDHLRAIDFEFESHWEVWSRDTAS